jgi:hypothetical protein
VQTAVDPVKLREPVEVLLGVFQEPDDPGMAAPRHGDHPLPLHVEVENLLPVGLEEDRNVERDRGAAGKQDVRGLGAELHHLSGVARLPDDPLALLREPGRNEDLHVGTVPQGRGKTPQVVDVLVGDVQEVDLAGSKHPVYPFTAEHTVHVLDVPSHVHQEFPASPLPVHGLDERRDPRGVLRRPLDVELVDPQTPGLADVLPHPVVVVPGDLRKAFDGERPCAPDVHLAHLLPSPQAGVE